MALLSLAETAAKWYTVYYQENALSQGGVLVDVHPPSSAVELASKFDRNLVIEGTLTCNHLGTGKASVTSFLF